MMTDTRGETVLTGIGVGRGAAVGPVVRAHPAPRIPTEAPAPADPEAEAERVAATFSDVASLLRERAAGARGDLASVLGATALMASDSALVGEVTARVRVGVASSVAVGAVVGQFISAFAAAGGYLSERVTDLASVRDRVVARLEGMPEPGVPALTQPSVVVAEDLSPADTSAMDLDRVLAIVIEKGGATSHTAIIARQLGLPCVVCVTGSIDLADGDVVSVDAARGQVVRDPDERRRASVAIRRESLRVLEAECGDGATADGYRVQLLANIGTPDDADRVARSAVEGVGLFRTEVLFLDTHTAPTLETQATVYARVLTALGHRKVVIRTLDAGADKPLAFVNQTGEDNPALGVRGYRLRRQMPALLDTQLAAIAEAAERTDAAPWVMAPMISTVHEAAEFVAAARAAHLEYVGVMVEVPSAALRARDILEVVDFVSLGTNDLAQYTMAADRLRGELADLLDMWQPAVLDLVAATAEAGIATGKPVGVCGESASDPVMALALAGMGVTSLSMASAALPDVRFALRAHSRNACQQIAAAARRAATAKSARAAALRLVDRKVREALALD